MTHTATMPAVEASTRDPFDMDPMQAVRAGRAASIVPGRRVTGRQLMRRLRADALLDDRLSNARALPLGARPVLEAVAELMAASPEPGVYRPDPELDGPIYEQIARRLRFHGGEAEVEGHFGRLVRAGLLLVGEGDAIVWPVAVSGTAKGVAVGVLGIRSLDTGGRPRRHETKEQARERRLAARHARGDAQRSMTLVIPGGGSTVPSRAANLSAETQNTEVRFSGEVSEAENSAETRVAGSEVALDGFQGGEVGADEVWCIGAGGRS